MASRADSTMLPTPTNGASTAQCALYVALHTMKERCLKLQKSLSCVQEENLALRQNRIHSDNASERHQQQVPDLIAQVVELTHAKVQLSDRISMVSSENRHLWSRLSQITKDQNDTPVFGSAKDTTPVASPTTQNQNLIRSKTFTQNAPNPALRSKMHPDVGGAAQDELSLEEISLKVLNEIMDSKAELEKMCEDLTTARTSETSANTFGFGYLNDEVVTGGLEAVEADDVHTELKRCSEGMADIRKEVLRQQSDIKVALSNLRKKRFIEACPSCKLNLRHQSTEHMATEEDQPLTTTTLINKTDKMTNIADVGASPVAHQIIDFFEQKRLADTLDKMCPMCAKMYNDSESFDDFQEHVESHFIDDSDLLDNSLEKNFELVSHTVGDF